MLDTDEGFGDVTVEVSTNTVHIVPLIKLREAGQQQRLAAGDGPEGECEMMLGTCKFP
jgi:hypothetical protein